MLFSCLVDYRAISSKPLFGQFLYGVLGSSPKSRSRRFGSKGIWDNVLRAGHYSYTFRPMAVGR